MTQADCSRTTAERADALFHQHLEENYAWTDRLFAGLLAFQWGASIAVALWITPLAWAGAHRQTHPHIWAALLLGSCIVSLPISLALLRPGRTITRQVIAIAQMLMGALLIHLTGGRIETHFHIFGSLAFLSFYRDWKVLVTASAVVVVDHFVRGAFWAESIFGVLTASPWRWLEHTGWVIFEDLFLVYSCIHGVRRSKEIALRQARQESIQAEIEGTVQQRTAQLSWANEQFSLLLDSTAEGIYGIDVEGICIFCNPACARLVGYESPDNLLGQKLHSLLHHTRPDGSPYPVSECRIQQAFRDGKGTHVEDEVMWRANSTSFPVEYWSNPMYRDGVPIGTVVTFVEISERKRNEASLRLSFAAMEAAANGIAITDIKGVLEWVNPAFTKLTGYAPAEAIGQNVRFLKSGHQSAEFYEKMWKTITAGEVWHGELVNKRKDGSFYDEEITITPVRAGTGPISQFVAIKQDITERRRSGEVLRDSEEKLRSLMESIPNIVWMTRPDGWNIYCNQRWMQYTGLTVEESYGFGWNDAFHPDDRQAALQAWQRAREADAPYENESRLRGADGTYRWFINRGLPLHDKSGRVLKWFGTCTDIDGQKRIAVELKEARIAADSANRAKSEFLAHMSHEIRTPMNGILGMTELVLDTPLSLEQREYLGLVKLSADSLLKIINDILDFSKIEAGQMSLHLADFNFRDTVGKVAKIMALRANEKHLELILNIAADVPDALTGDANRLRQIIINLVGNAIKFTDQGQVVVGVQVESRTDSSVELHCSIADTGIGIPRGEQEKLFQAFQQLDGSNTRRHGGTGLGLVITQRLVHMMSGRIWFESEIGRGATFHFIIKLGIGHKIIAPIPLGMDELTDLSVLVVDDNATNRQIVHDLLQHWHMRPILADGSPAALRAVDDRVKAGQSFKLLLVDVGMPDIDGFDLVEKIRQRPGLESAVIMMLTSADQPGDRARCRQLGIDVYLVKPVLQDDLQQAILSALSKKVPATELPRADAKKEHLQLATRSRHILLAEDQRVNQRLAVRFLEKRGHSVVVANNGREALDLLAREPFDVVLMDVQMPEMDGFEATRSIRLKEQSTGKHLPIIAMTAYAMHGDRERCLAAGCDEYLTKPIDAQSLYKAVENSLFVAKPTAAESVTEN